MKNIIFKIIKKNITIICVTLFFLLIICPAVNAEEKSSIELTGDILAYMMPAGAGSAALIKKDPDGFFQLSGALAVTIGTSLLLKYTVQEERPNRKDYLSFPSMHSSVSFASAEFMRRRYGWRYGIPCYATALFVAFSRVHAKQHFVHDTIAGALTGIGSSFLFTKPGLDVQINADIKNNSYGIKLSYKWQGGKNHHSVSGNAKSLK